MNEDLFERYLRNELDEAGVRELSAVLATEEGAREFAAFVQEWTLLGEAARHRVAAAERHSSRRIRKVRPAPASDMTRTGLAWAAGLAAAAIFVLLLVTPARIPRREEKAIARVDDPPAPVIRPEVPPAPPPPASKPPERLPVTPPPTPPRSDPPVEPPKPPPPPPPAPPAPEKPSDPRPPTEPEKKVVRAVVALVGRVQGDVHVTSAAGRRKAAAGEGLGADEGLDATGAGSHAALEFPDGSTVELGPDTAIDRVSEKQGRRSLSLARGTVAATVTKQPAGRTMAVTTAHAEVTVIGTQFSVAALTDSSRVDVREGRVVLKRLPDLAVVEVTAGHFAIAAKGVKLESKPIVHTRELPVAADTELSGADPSRAFGSDEVLEVDGDEVEGKKLYGLLRWDLSEIPATAIVKSAVITLTIADASNGLGYSFHSLKRHWTEADATWRTAAPGQSWAVAGARSSRDDRAAEVLGTLAPRAKGEVRVLLNPSAEAVIQSWIRQPASNHGFIIANDSNTDGFKFYSRESSNPDRRPRLTITYTLTPK